MNEMDRSINCGRRDRITYAEAHTGHFKTDKQLPECYPADSPAAQAYGNERCVLGEVLIMNFEKAVQRCGFLTKTFGGEP